MKKLNAFIDGLFTAGDHSGGIGIVYRDDELSIQRLSSLKAKDVQSAMEVKMLGVLKALEYAEAEGYHEVGLFADDDELLDALNGRAAVDDERVMSLYFRIRVMTHKFISVVFSRIPWNLNKMAHSLARKPIPTDSRPEAAAAVLELPFGFGADDSSLQTG